MSLAIRSKVIVRTRRIETDFNVLDIPLSDDCITGTIPTKNLISSIPVQGVRSMSGKQSAVLGD